MPTPPGVLISSTFYDLKQIRADLFDFFDAQLGYRALAFENSGFPVDADASAIENCRRRVEEDADMLVLVVGARYGDVPKDYTRSVTNLEFAAARAKGIPIHVFAQRTVLDYLHLWKKNPENDFSSVVDTPALFAFLDDIKANMGIWVHPFERAQDIISILREQIAFQVAKLFRDALKVVAANDPCLRELRGRAFQIALERPRFWEHDLFAIALRDEINQRSDLATRYRKKFHVGSGEVVGVTEVTWFSDRLGEMSAVAPQLQKLMQIDLQEAQGAPGESGSVEKIVYVAKRIGDIYQFALEWAIRIRLAVTHPLMRELQEEFALASTSFVDNIESLAKDYAAAIAEAKVQVANGKKAHFELLYDLEFDASRLIVLMDRLRDAVANGEHL